MFKSFWKYNIFWLLWLCLITYLSNAKSDGIPEFSLFKFKGFDKVVHFIFYLNLTFLMVWGLKSQSAYLKIKNNTFFISFCFAIAWGSLMELSQLFIFTYRSAEFLDILANTIGASLAVIISKFLYKSTDN